jgi:hypothetical protein
MTFHGEAASLIVGQSEPFGAVGGAKDSILFE